MKKRGILFGLLVFALCLGVFQLFQQKKPGFTLGKVRSSFEPSGQWAIEEPPPDEKQQIHTILSQDFNYLGSGAECYAFLSADGNYVLKFFKMKHLLPKNWLKWIPLPGLDQYRFSKIDKRIIRQIDLFSGYKMAYEHLKEETGLVYVHLNKSEDLKVKAHLYNRMRKCFIADLDQYEFIVQKRAQLIRDRIISYMQKGHKEGVKWAIHHLFERVVDQCKKGFVDRDSGISHNYGFVGDQVIHFDVGRIEKAPNASDPSYYQREVLRVGKKLEDWLSQHYPELLVYLEEEINEWIDLAPHHE